MFSERKEPSLPHASGKEPFSRFELIISPRSANMVAQVDGSVLQTEKVMKQAVVSGRAVGA